MDIDNILQQLRYERGRLDAAISALEGGARRRGRPPKGQPTRPKGKRRGPRHMSVAARAKIAAAQRARWAKQKAGVTPKKPAAKKATAKKGRKGMSAAARRRLSELMKQRWAARKKST